MNDTSNNDKPRLRGKICKWIGLGGFGFILPADSPNEVFFHVSALRDSSIEPAVGDVVTYSISQRHDGRTKAVQIEVETAT